MTDDKPCSIHDNGFIHDPHQWWEGLATPPSGGFMCPGRTEEGPVLDSGNLHEALELAREEKRLQDAVTATHSAFLALWWTLSLYEQEAFLRAKTREGL